MTVKLGSRWRRILVHAGFGLQLAAIISLAACSNARPAAAPTVAASPTSAVQAETKSDLTMTLLSVAATTDGTQIDFEVTLPDFAAASSREDVLGPIAPGIHLQLEGFQDRPDQFSVSTHPRIAGSDIFPFSLNLPPVVDFNQPVTVTFTELPFYTNPGQTFVPGPWTFIITPEMLRSPTSG
jgi:hypothetical protein